MEVSTSDLKLLVNLYSLQAEWYTRVREVMHLNGGPVCYLRMNIGKVDLSCVSFAEAFTTWTMPPLLSAGERWGQAVGNGKRGGGSHFPSVCPGGKKLKITNLLVDLVSV